MQLKQHSGSMITLSATIAILEELRRSGCANYRCSDDERDNATTRVHTLARCRLAFQYLHGMHCFKKLDWDMWTVSEDWIQTSGIVRKQNSKFKIDLPKFPFFQFLGWLYRRWPNLKFNLNPIISKRFLSFHIFSFFFCSPFFQKIPPGHGIRTDPPVHLHLCSFSQKIWKIWFWC